MRVFLYTLLSLCVWLSAAAAAAAESAAGDREFQLKTAYLFHFAELTRWPEPRPIVICLRGASPLRKFLPVLEGQTIDGAPVHVAFEANAGIGGCSILFLAENGLLTADVAEQARAGHVLLVGDSDGFAAAGGMVQFSLRDNKLKLVVNLAPVKSAHLTLSSKLLRMAELIE